VVVGGGLGGGKEQPHQVAEQAMLVVEILSKFCLIYAKMLPKFCQNSIKFKICPNCNVQICPNPSFNFKHIQKINF
jgi:hypothetical protein